MDERNILTILIALLIGVSIGYIGQNMIKPYVETYMFTTALTINGNSTATVGQTVTFTSELDALIPTELLTIPNVRQYLLQDKKITLVMKEKNSQYWYIVEEKMTVYANDKGIAVFQFQFASNGTFTFVAKFEGSSILKSSNSNELIVVVT